MKKSTCALCLLLLLAGCDFSERMPAEMAAISQSRPLEKEKALESSVRFDIGSLEITSGKQDGSLFSYDLEYDKASFAPEFHYSAAMDGAEGKLTINLQSSRRKKIHPERLNNRLRLALSDSIPLTLKIRAGVGDARLALSNLKISKVDFESGVGEARLSAYEPNVVPCELIHIKNGVGRLEAIGLGNLNFRDLEFEGGVGGANLDFSGEWKQNASVKISVGVGGVNVRMPREIGVRVEAEKNWLSGLHLEGFNLRGSDYYSENYDKAAVRVSVRVTTGIGGFRINWL